MQIQFTATVNETCNFFALERHEPNMNNPFAGHSASRTFFSVVSAIWHWNAIVWMLLMPNFCNLFPRILLHFPRGFYFRVCSRACIHKQNKIKHRSKLLFTMFSSGRTQSELFLCCVSNGHSNHAAISCSWIPYKSLEWINTLIDCECRGNARFSSKINFFRTTNQWHLRTCFGMPPNLDIILSLFKNPRSGPVRHRRRISEIVDLLNFCSAFFEAGGLSVWGRD